ncbi:MAG: pyridoxal-phosphate dependent enzyme [Thermofilum sp.]
MEGVDEDSSSKRIQALKLKAATPLIPLTVSKHLFGLNGHPVFVKWEGANPTGTHKDRAALAHVAAAVERGYAVVTAGTCGNYGVALAYYALLAGVKAVIFVPKGYENSRVSEMRRYGAKVVFVEGSYEEAVALSSRAANSNGWYDANPGSPNDVLSLRAYSAIAKEIVVELGDAPYAVAVPVGNGTTLAGLYLGFLEMYREGLATRMPRLIAASTSHANQVVESWKRGSVEPVEVPPSSVSETPVNEPLVAYEALNARDALKALYLTKGRAYAFGDEEMVEASLLLRATERISALPASSSSILALREFLKEEPEGPLVAVITGRWQKKR